jgi:hypothetical protein
MPDCAIVARDIGVLLGLIGLDIGQADVCRAVVHANGLGLSTPFDNVVELADGTFGRLGKVHLDPQTIAAEVIQPVHLAERAAIHFLAGEYTYSPRVAPPICHDSLTRPYGALRHGQGVWCVPPQPFAGLDPQVPNAQ